MRSFKFTYSAMSDDSLTRITYRIILYIDMTRSFKFVPWSSRSLNLISLNDFLCFIKLFLNKITFFSTIFQIRSICLLFKLTPKNDSYCNKKKKITI